MARRGLDRSEQKGLKQDSFFGAIFFRALT